MEASVDHMAREASSVRRYPSSLPWRAAWSCLTEGSGLSSMVRSTLHAEGTSRQSETVPCLSHHLFSPAEVRFGVAENAVGLGQGYPHGPSLALSSIRT